MRIQFRPTLLLLLLSVVTLSNCEKDPASGAQQNDEFLDENTWINDLMSSYYYWNNNVPDEIPGDTDPEIYFEGMLESSDIFSYIRDDAATYLEELNGVSYTAGYSPAFGRFSGSDDVFIIVEFVYPGSPADSAGLERGDIILEINNSPLTIYNYLDLYYASGTSVLTLGQANYNTETGGYSIGLTGTQVSVVKDELTLDPVVHTATVDTAGHKIGYLFYARFLVGETSEFITSLNNALESLKTEGVTDLVVDLRYNPGGRVDAATSFANILAPEEQTQNEDVFVSYKYNTLYQNYLIDQYGLDSDYLYTRFSTPEVSMGLDAVYFLTTNSSASASELLINGLTPYMDVYQIGTNTYGKFYGAYVFSGTDASPSHNYLIAPVSLKYANSIGTTDFVDGLDPDFEVDEDILSPEPIGDAADPLFATAIEHILTGNVTAKMAKIRKADNLELLPDHYSLQRGNIFEIKRH
ncbi:MAG TPA: hypothetical protein DEQ34_00340 [Balneolaceae bacterium]|nr:hypothetical protein [Balneolaceae bacterium]|tara:strand:+ start:123042 stop:124445 length:1404 start_codon:yes stop_codon:yes gene_type:complete